MLVLSRKNRETIVIDGRITVKVLQIKGGAIRLGIEAPPEMSIRRGELLEHGEAPDPGAEAVASITLAPGVAPSISYTCAAS
jgi:carbon storage regulator